MRSRAIRHLVARPARRSVSAGWRALPFPVRAPTEPRGVERVESRRFGTAYDTDWARRPPARALTRSVTELVWRPAVRYYADPTVRGADRLADLDDTGVIFASNHHSHADTPLLITTIPRPWRDRIFVAAAADYFFPGPVTSTLSALGISAVPIERTRVSKRSLELPIRLLREGWSQVIYPEGGRSPDGWGQDFRPGVSLIARSAGVPVVPVHIWGTDRVLGRGDSWPERAAVVINFGVPLRPRPDEDHRHFAHRLGQAVAELADETSSDWWSARRRAHTGATPSLSGPQATSWRRAWALDQDRGRKRRQRRWPQR